MEFSLELTLLTSLKIIFMYGAMKPGMVFDFLPRVFDWVLHWLPMEAQLYLKKPLYDCVFCMASVWGLLFTYQYFEITVDYVFLILQVGGVNYLVATIIGWYHDQEEKNERLHEQALFKEKEATK